MTSSRCQVPVRTSVARCTGRRRTSATSVRVTTAPSIRKVSEPVDHRETPARADFPATIGLLLESPLPEVDLNRDSVSAPNTLQFTDILDLLSDEELECASPGLHRGWEDRRFACRRSRVTAQGAVGIVLSEAEREQLLLLAAYRNRIFRYPPPVRIVPGEVLPAFAALKSLVGRLLEA